MPRTALRAPAELADILIIIPHILTTHRAEASLEEDTAASGSVTPAVSCLDTTTATDKSADEHTCTARRNISRGHGEGVEGMKRGSKA